LDDFVPRPEMQPLVDLASYIKVDFQASDASQRKAIRAMARSSDAAMLAEKVESQEEFKMARGEGFKYFQGFFFCRPTIIENREIPANRMNYLHLLSELSRDQLDLREVARIVQMEASLCYRLLLLANSARWCRRTDVTSVQDAFILVGEHRFRALVCVATSGLWGQNQPPALIAMSLERARFCELMAPLVGETPSEQFMRGQLSLLDAILEIPMESIVKTLPLRPEAKAALLGGKGRVAMPLSLIRGFESGAWASCAHTASELGIGEEKLSQLYMDSVKWATESLSSSI